MRLPETLAEIAVRLADVASGVDGNVLLEPLSVEELEIIRQAVRPDVLPIELEEFLRLHVVSPWNEPRPTVHDTLEYRALMREDPRTQHWLPIGRREKDVWHAVLGGEPLPRSPVVVWSSNALVTAAPFPSLRTFLLAYTEALQAAGDLYPDAIPALASIDWWQAATNKSWSEDAWPLWNRLERPVLELIAAEDSSPLWPPGTAPMPFLDNVDRDDWTPQWRSALQVS